VMRAVTAAVLGGLVLSTFASMLGDPASRNLRRVGASLAGLRHSPFLTRSVLRQLRAYNRRGFHPDDRDLALAVERWRAELFGSDGSVTEPRPDPVEV
jgi:predicted metal-dependent hydrolase